MYQEEYLSETMALKNNLIKIYNRKKPPGPDEYLSIVNQTNNVLTLENEQIRPYCIAGRGTGEPGGIIHLKRDIPTIIVPDLHARMNFFLNIMFAKVHEHTVLAGLALNKVQVVCMGDGFHAEGRAAKRWQKAFEEYSGKYQKHRYIDEEMKESLGIMEMIMRVKCAFPDNFHFLKGNHENIANERGGGNYPFRKYAYEGAMVLEYINKFYGNTFLKTYYSFEKRLPLLAIGRNFLISHAEPQYFYEYNDVLHYKDNPHIVQGLTWTDNNAAEPGSVREMLEIYLELPDLTGCYYFGGHRAVLGKFSKRADGKYIQIHNPNKFIIAVIQPEGDIDLEKDIMELKDELKQLLLKGGG